MSFRSRSVLFVALAATLAVIAWLAPDPNRATDRSIYEATARQIVVRDCSDIHCFRVLVPWVLGRIPGSDTVVWKLFAALCNAWAACAVASLARRWGATPRGELAAAWLSAVGMGSLYTLFDPFTADPLMYALGPSITLVMLDDRLALAGVWSAVGVLAKEFAAAPLLIFTGYRVIRREPRQALRVLAVALLPLIVWGMLQLVLMLRYNYSYAGNASTALGDGAYLRHWLATLSPRGALTAIFNEYGAVYLLAAVGLATANRQLRQLSAAAIPALAAFVYVQQPDRALWNFHFLAVPLAVVVLDRAPAAVTVAFIVCFGLANLRLGAQLPMVPSPRISMIASLLIAVAAVVAPHVHRHPSAIEVT